MFLTKKKETTGTLKGNLLSIWPFFKFSLPLSHARSRTRPHTHFSVSLNNSSLDHYLQLWYSSYGAGSEQGSGLSLFLEGACVRATITPSISISPLSVHQAWPAVESETSSYSRLWCLCSCRYRGTSPDSAHICSICALWRSQREAFSVCMATRTVQQSTPHRVSTAGSVGSFVKRRWIHS